MKKSTIIWIVVAVIVLICGFSACSMYNGLVEKNAKTEEAWANVETYYQRRSDLIPNLVNTVKGYAEHEKSTLEEVVAQRAKATQVQVNFDDLTPENMAKYQAAQNQISSALGKLLAISESYPDLKANTNFIALQDELAGTENRIAIARKDFNGAVKEFNVAIMTFPRNIIANMGGFTKKAMFESQEGAETAPKVEF